VESNDGGKFHMLCPSRRKGGLKSSGECGEVPTHHVFVVINTRQPRRYLDLMESSR
jgi:hypothetical protein